MQCPSELISHKCTSGARRARFWQFWQFWHMSAPSTHDKEQRHQLVPRIWALKGWRCFSDSWEDTSIWFQTCWDVTISLFRGRDSGVTGALWNCFLSFALLPLRVSHRLITRGADLGALQTVLLSQQSVLQRAVPETKLPRIRCIFCTARILTWRGVYPKKRTLEVCPGLVKFMVWFCSTGWESALNCITVLGKCHSWSICSCIYSYINLHVVAE